MDIFNSYILKERADILKHINKNVSAFAFDLEHTAEKKNQRRIIQIGGFGLDYDNNNFQVVNEMFGGGRSMSFAIEVHKISDEMREGLPTFEDRYKDYIKYFKSGSIIIGHNVKSTDINMVQERLSFTDFEGSADLYVIDTLVLAKCLESTLKGKFGIKDNKLGTLCEYFKITYGNHDALGDAYSSLMLMEIFFKEFMDIEINPDSSVAKLVEFAKNPEAFNNAVEICDAEIEESEFYPDDCDNSFDVNTSQNLEYFKYKIRKGWAMKKIPMTKEYVDRVKYEIDVVSKMGFVDYFLIIADILEYARENSIPKGPGRGCFTPNNRVRVNKHFYKNINDVSIGDKVQCEDGEWREVEKVWEYDCDEDVLVIKTKFGQVLNGITFDHKVKIITAENYSSGNLMEEWVESSKIKNGDHIVNMKTGFSMVSEIETKKYKGKVYDLQVKDVHSYTVDDLVVHNSAAGSLIAYAMDITTIDPIRFGLYFERFLNPGRAGKIVLSLDKISFDDFEKNILPQCDTDINFYDYVIEDRKEFLQEAEKEWDNISLEQKKYVAHLCLNNICGKNTSNSRIFYLLGICDNINNSLPVSRSGGSNPDVDIDLCTNRRKEVVLYLQRKYGEDKVANIITFGKMWSRAVIRDVGRALDLPTGDGSDIDLIAKLFPSTDHDFDKAIVESEQLQKYQAKYPELFERARDLSGKPKSCSVHAAGVVITPQPLYNYFPLHKSPNSDMYASITQWDMYAMDETGFLKVDLLGLNTLTVMDKTVKLISKIHNINVDLEEINLEDADTINLFREGKTTGLFQLERKYVQEMCKRMDIRSFEDVCALNALIRPGTLHSGMTEEYIKRKLGESPREPLADCLRDTLKNTMDIMIYQEDLMRVVSDYAGFSLAESDDLRKGVSKKMPEKVAKAKELFLKKSVEMGRPKDEAESIFNKIETFASYGFNRCLALNSLLEKEDGSSVLLKDIKIGDKILAPSDNGDVDEYTEVLDVIDTGEQEVYKITFESGKTITSTLNHKHACSDGIKRSLSQILEESWEVMCRGISFMSPEKITKVERIGIVPTKDITVSNKKHRFYANGVCTSNSHAVSYGKITFQSAWLKTHFLIEFMAELLNGEANTGGDSKIDLYVREARSNGLIVIPPDARAANSEFRVVDKKSILFGLSFIKKVTDNVVDELRKNAKNMTSFSRLLLCSDNRKLKKDAMENLIKAGAFDFMGGTRAELIGRYLATKEIVEKFKSQRKRKSSGVKLRVENTVKDVYLAEKNFKYEGSQKTPQQIIKDEYEVCECYVDKDPLWEYQEMVSGSDFRDIWDVMDRRYSGVVKVLVISKLVKLHTITKETDNFGRTMAFMDVYDSIMDMSCIIFPDVYEKHKDDIKDDCVYVLTGFLNDRESFVVNNIKFLSEI